MKKLWNGKKLWLLLALSAMTMGRGTSQDRTDSDDLKDFIKSVHTKGTKTNVDFLSTLSLEHQIEYAKAARQRPTHHHPHRQKTGYNQAGRFFSPLAQCDNTELFPDRFVIPRRRGKTRIQV